jgi:hypothetical protein
MSARTWRSPCSSAIRCLGASCQPDCSYARQVIPLAIVFALLDALRRVLLRPYDPHRSAGRLVAASVAFLCGDGFADRQAWRMGRRRRSKTLLTASEIVFRRTGIRTDDRPRVGNSLCLFLKSKFIRKIAGSRR